MKIYAHHDLSGKISSVVTFVAPKGAGLMLTPKRGLLVSELGGLRLTDQRDFEAVRALTLRKVVVKAAEHVAPEKP